ncbi:hypothetical protein TNCV_3900211 [Trichonephila clavipes]|nr:hypothetical protein TNCV_3900211 [Trichonephila clavipes]
MASNDRMTASCVMQTHLPQTKSESLLSLVQIDHGAAMLNALLHSNDCEGNRVTQRFLKTNLYSALYTSSVAKHWNGNVQNYPFTV